MTKLPRIERIEDPGSLTGIFQHFTPLHQYIRTETNIEPTLAHLVSMRASQINGCAHCMAIHAGEGLRVGDRVDRYAILPAWHEVPDWFTPRERAALLWTETLTKISTEEISDETYARVREEFDEKDLADLTLLVVAINGANRVAIPFRAVPNRFELPEREEVAAD